MLQYILLKEKDYKITWSMNIKVELIDKLQSVRRISILLCASRST